MRPLRLAIEGFTAFRDRQEVDFEPLDLFVITGPTGAEMASPTSIPNAMRRMCHWFSAKNGSLANIIIALAIAV